MKKILNYSGLIPIIFSIFSISSCKKDKTEPVISTEGVTQITYTSATSGGIVTGDGGSEIIARGICWNTSTGPTTSNNTTNETGTIGSFASNLTNLTQNTTYYVRAYAVNSVGTSYGNEVTFNTNKVAAPELTTTEITAITQRTAISGGNISADNGGSITSRGVCWAKVTSPTITDNKTIDGSGTGTYVSNISGLEGGTIYYIRSYATNNAGTSYGNELTFTTVQATLPVITSTVMSLITPTTASSGGNVTADGGSSISARGVCWGTTANPTVANNKTTDGTGTGSFISSITGMTPGTTYYLKAYATNNAGTAYGDQVTFMTVISDVDQNIYKTVVIGTQVWMAENLKTTKYRNGDIIGTTNPATKDISAEVTPKYQWSYNGDETKVSVYGRLYTWYAITDSRGVCPEGWHIPTDSEWSVLASFVGDSTGGKLKETGLVHWISPNAGATNKSGFTGLPGGEHSFDGQFLGIGLNGYYLSATEYNLGNVLIRYMVNSDIILINRYAFEYMGFSVRCLKN
jgi:uncharacterized protein (TIGR02145 family)